MSPLLEADRSPAPAPALPASPRARMLLEFASEVERRAIPCCVLRGEHGFPDLHPGGDLDLLTEARHSAALVALVVELARKHGVNVWERRRMGFMQQLLLYSEAAPGAHEFFGVDVHESEACFGVPFLDARDVLARARRVGPLLRPDPAQGACINAVGAWLSGGRVPERHAAAFRDALELDPEGVERELGRWFGAAHARAMLAASAADAELGARWPLGRLRRALLGRAFARAPLRSLRALLSYAFAVRVRPLFAPRGRTLAFLGTDGSGKSSVLAAVLRTLEPVFGSRRLHVFHMRPGVLPQLNALAHFGRTTYTLEDMRDPHRAAPSGRLGSAARALYYGADYVLGHALRVLPLRRRCAIVAFDRYIDDYRVDPLRSRIRRGLPGLALLCRLVPRPDHVFVCSAPLETVRARKQELDETECARQLVLYEQLARELPEARLVRTTGTVEEAADQVVRSVFGEPRG